jgi:GAF domain-containing protein
MAALPGRTRDDRITGEQAALRRVATLVARGAPPEEVFAAVAEESGRVLEADFTFLSWYGPDGAATIVGTWARTGTARPLSVGTRWGIDGRNLHTLLFQTHRAARIDDYIGASGPVAEAARGIGLRSAVGVPISAEGRLWGTMVVGSTREQPLPADSEERLAGFTELAATAIANAEAQAALAASRARIVATADQTRRRIERNLHDGAQQRLVSLALSSRPIRNDAVRDCGGWAPYPQSDLCSAGHPEPSSRMGTQDDLVVVISEEGDEGQCFGDHTHRVAVCCQQRGGVVAAGGVHGEGTVRR